VGIALFGEDVQRSADRAHRLRRATEPRVRGPERQTTVATPSSPAISRTLRRAPSYDSTLVRLMTFRSRTLASRVRISS
jgi:hypothetical protein